MKTRMKRPYDGGVIDVDSVALAHVVGRLPILSCRDHAVASSTLPKRGRGGDVGAQRHRADSSRPRTRADAFVASTAYRDTDSQRRVGSENLSGNGPPAMELDKGKPSTSYRARQAKEGPRFQDRQRNRRAAEEKGLGKI